MGLKWKDKYYKLYKFPDMDCCLANRQLINGNSDLMYAVNENQNPGGSIWYFVAYPTDCTDNRSPSGALSDASSQSEDVCEDVRIAAHFTSQFCDKQQHSQLNEDLHVGYLYETKSLSLNEDKAKAGKFTHADQRAIYFSLDIGGLNEVRNMLSLLLCSTCNAYFDAKHIAIDPATDGCIVSPTLYDKPIDHVPGIKNY
jgi:hypothetical protein